MKKRNILLIGLGAALATAAILFLLKRKRAYEEEKPPRKAPQIPLHNPGEQSEFTTSASESDIG
jgi:LPXTG-motif cell wall-anchored protein